MLAKKNNVYLYRDSQNAAFSLTALEFVAEQIFSQTAVNSDLVSLVNFDTRGVSVPIEREPIGWPVYNKILSHRDRQRYEDRQMAPYYDRIHGGSDFLPALDKAAQLLKVGQHKKCALSLFFFSDGQSTDHTSLGIDRSEALQQIMLKAFALATPYGASLTFTVVGLGNSNDDFSVLQNMAAAAKVARAKSSFQLCNKTANTISSAIKSLVTSTTETRTSLQQGRTEGYTTREDAIDEKTANVKSDWQYFRILDHLVFDPRTKNLEQCDYIVPLAAIQHNPEEAVRRRFDPPPFVAVNRNFFGKGAERLAFRCRLSDGRNASSFVFNRMIAKETKDIERIDEKKQFHLGFMETQDLANYLAFEFNRHLRGLPDYNPTTTPQIKFLNCSILVLRDPDWPSGKRSVLVEKMLDTGHFAWTKWNDNNGMVDGYKHVAVNVDFELQQIEKKEQGGLLAITEEDESDDDDDDDESVSEGELEGGELKDTNAPIRDISPRAYLQAFSHFSYRYTNRKVLVCDLQGVFNTEMIPPTFELTDPCIHYSSDKGRRMVFGRTDKGRSGMQSFCKTHKCTNICKFLELSGRNEKWRRDWHHNPSWRSNK